MSEKQMVAKLILDASSYQKAVQIAKTETSTIKKEMELWKVENDKTATSLSGLVKQAKSNAETQKILTAEITRTKQQYTETSEKMGVNSAAAMKLKNNLLDMQIAQAKLNTELGGGLTHMQNFKNGMNVVGEQLQKTGDKMVSVGTGFSKYITAPAIAAGVGIIKLADDAAKYADEIGVMSEKTGLSAKSTQEWMFTLNQLDIPIDTVQKSMTQFTNKLKGVEAGTGDSSKAMKALGISMSDSAGKTRPISDVYNEVIGKLSGMKNESDRNITASKLFGKSWVELAPLLNAGSAEVERLKAQAHSLGLVMSDESIAKARAFGDSMDALKMQFKVAGAEIGTAFMPILTGALIPFIQNNVIPAVKGFASHISGLINWFKTLSPETQKTIGIITGLVVAIGPALIIIGKLTTGISAGIKAFSLLFSPVTLIVIGIAALAAAAYLVIKNWDTVVPFFMKMWDVIKSVFNTYIAGVMVELRGLQYGLATVLDFIYGNLLKAVSGILGILSNIPYIGKAFEVAKKGVDILRDGIKGFKESSKRDLDESVANLKSNAGNVASNWKSMADAGGDMVSGMGKTIGSAISGVSGMFSSIPAAANAEIPKQKQAGKDLGDALGDGLTTGTDKSAKAMAAAVKTIDKEYAPALNNLKNEIKKLSAPTGSYIKDLENQKKAYADNHQIIVTLVNKYKEQVKALGETNEATQKTKTELASYTAEQDKLAKSINDTAVNVIKGQMTPAINALNKEIKSLLIPTGNLQKDLENQQKAYKDTHKVILDNVDIYKQVVAQYGRYSDQAKTVLEANSKLTASQEELGNNMVEQAQRIKDEAIKNINNLNSAILAALKRKYEAQKALDDNALKIETDNLDKWKTKQLKYISDVHDKAIEALDLETKNKVSAVQAQIDAIDLQKDTEEEAKKNKEELDKIALLQNQLNNNAITKSQADLIEERLNAEEEAKKSKEELDKIASIQSELTAETDAKKRLEIQKNLNDSISDRNDRLNKNKLNAEKDALIAQEKIAKEKLDIQTDINDLILSRTERLHQNEVQKQREALQKQIDAIKSAAETKKEQLDKDLKAQEVNLNTQYDNEKINLDKRKANIDAYYTGVLSTAIINAEAQKLIMGNNQVEIAALLNTYGSLYEDSGKTLGESFYDGFKTWADQVALLIANANAATGNTTELPSTEYYSNPTVLDPLEQIRRGLTPTPAAATPEAVPTPTVTASRAAEIAAIDKAIAAAKAAAAIAAMQLDPMERMRRYGYAEGTNSATPGWKWTGEKGPELINFRGGEQVVPNSKLGGNTIQVVITGNTIAKDMDIHTIGDKLVTYLKSKGVRLAVPY